MFIVLCMHTADLDDIILRMGSLSILYRGSAPILPVVSTEIPQPRVNHVCVVQNAYVKRSQCTETWSDCMQRILPHYWSPYFWKNRTLFWYTNQLTSVVPGWLSSLKTTWTVRNLCIHLPLESGRKLEQPWTAYTYTSPLNQLTSIHIKSDHKGSESPS